MWTSKHTPWLAVGFAGCLLLAGPAPRATADEAGVSVVDWLDARGEDSSFEARRRRFAEIYPGERYAGTADQNLRLLGRLRVAADSAQRLRGVATRPERPTPPPGDDMVERPPEPPDPAAWGDAPVLRRCSADGREAVFDLRPQVLRLDLEDETAYQRVERPDPSADRVLEQPLLARPDLDPHELVSAGALAWKAKRFDDGLMAAVELAVQEQEKGPFLARLQSLLAVRRTGGAGAACVVAACRLGGLPLAAWLDTEASDMIRGFDADEARSTPLGVFTWSPELRAVFRQDRMLQTRILSPAAAPLAEVLLADPASRAGYERLVTLYAQLTNPSAVPDLRALSVDDGARRPRVIAILPPASSREIDLADRLWHGAGPPAGATVMDALVAGVREGSVALEPTAASGWYDRQTWANEPLLRPESTPEGVRLVLGDRYRGYLGDLFRGQLALARETHVKQLDLGRLTAAPPHFRLRPRLSVEPLPTHYRRRAEAYAYVHGVLLRHFGAGGLAALHRRTADGPVETDLGTELDAMELLFRGAAATAELELGMDDGDASYAAARAAFAAWRERVAADPDLAGDSRMMVPVMVDPPRGEIVVRALLGWTRRVVRVEFARPPVAVPARDERGDPRHVPTGAATYSVALPVFAEVRVARLLDRDGFRALCDRWRTRSSILAHLR